MKRFKLSVLFPVLYMGCVSAQTNFVRPPALGISFVLNDFVTPERIRSSSLREVLHDKKWAKLSEMNSGLGLHYFQGLTPHLDFRTGITGSFTSNVVPDVDGDNSTLLL